MVIPHLELLIDEQDQSDHFETFLYTYYIEINIPWVKFNLIFGPWSHSSPLNLLGRSRFELFSNFGGLF